MSVASELHAQEVREMQMEAFKRGRLAGQQDVARTIKKFWDGTFRCFKGVTAKDADEIEAWLKLLD